MKLKIWFIGIAIMMLSLVSAYQISTFSNLQTSEALNFNNNQNITRNISMPIYVNVTSALMNISGLSLSQHIPNIYECVNFNGEDKIINCTNAFDYNDSTFASAIHSAVVFLYTNYTAPGSYNISDIRVNIISSGTTTEIYNFNSSSWITYSGNTVNSTIVNNGTILLRFKQTTIGGNAKIYEISVFWGNSSSYVSNPYLMISNKIWNYTGLFTSNITTSNFFSELNSALNKGKCDCIGCYLIGSNCSIPFIFHSDSTGILQYSNININYDTIPFVNYKSPDNNSYSSVSKTFSCNSTDLNLKNVTLVIWNSTSIYNNSETRIITGINNYTTFNPITFTRTDSYKWNCLTYNNNSYSNMFDDNYTLNVDVSSPIITLVTPNNQWYNSGNTNFSCSVEGPNLDSAFLVGNFTGGWGIIATRTGITSGVTNNFSISLPDDQYSWTCYANTTSGNLHSSPYGNYTIGIDTIYPTMNNLTIVTTPNSNQIQFTSNITDINLDSCKYSIWTGATPGPQISFSCNVPTLANAPGFGTYILNVYGKDKAGNENTQALTFITSISSGGIVTGGGSSAGVVSAGIPNWALTTDTGTKIYELKMNAGSSREKILQFSNNDNSLRKIILRCEKIGTYDLCPNIILDKNVTLPVLKKTFITSLMTIFIPQDTPNGVYKVNIIAKDDLGNEDSITVSVEVGAFGVVTDILIKLTSSKNIVGLQIPYIIIFFGMLLTFGFSSYIITRKKKYGAGLSLILSFVISISILVFI